MTEQRQAREIVLRRRWFTVAEVAEMLGFGLTKTKMLVVTGELRSLKDGCSRRILPEWVDEYVSRRAAEAESAFGRWSA
jgi:excisionase family DNA binding protein